MVPPIVQEFKVSLTDNPLNLESTQNPESFGREKPTPPAHIASPTKTGDIPVVKIVGPKIDDVVTKATVAEP